MVDGFILLLVIGAVVAYMVARARRRMGLAVTGKTWLVVMVGFVVIMLALWAGAEH